MNAVFGDTYYYLALLNPRDAAHAARTASQSISTTVVTTHWPLTDCISFVVMGDCGIREALTGGCALPSSRICAAALKSRVQEAPYARRPA